MLLERYLRDKEPGELKELYTFWDSDGHAPADADTLVRSLHEHMTDEDLVRKRLRFLSNSKKLIDLLKFLLKSERYIAGLQHILNSKAFAYMSHYEVEAALNALQKRGFVFVAGARGANGHTQFSIPRELGDILGSFLLESDRDLKDCLRLEGHLAVSGDGSREATDEAISESERPANECQSLCTADDIRSRLEQLDEDTRQVFDIAVWKFGGIFSKGAYDRHRPRLAKWDRAKLKDTLESAGLGTVRHFALGEYGINHFDDTVVIFEEVAREALTNIEPQDRVASEELRSLGVDFISDV